MIEKKAIIECRIPDGQTVPDCRQNLGWWCGKCPFSTLITLRDGLEIEVAADSELADVIKVNHIWV